MKKSLRSLLALAALAVAAFAVAPATASPEPTGYRMETQSVSVDKHADAAVLPVAVAKAQTRKHVNPISPKTADTGSGAESAYQAWLATQTAQTECRACRTASMDLMARKKGGGGKRWVEAEGIGSIPPERLTRST